MCNLKMYSKIYITTLQLEPTISHKEGGGMRGFPNSPKKGASDFLHKKGGVGKTVYVVLEKGGVTLLWHFLLKVLPSRKINLIFILLTPLAFSSFLLMRSKLCFSVCALLTSFDPLCFPGWTTHAA